MSKSKQGAKQIAKIALSAAEEFLLSLWETYDDTCFARCHPFLAMTVGAREGREIISESEFFRKEREKRQAIRRLKQMKFLKERKEGNRLEYELSANGQVAALETIMRCTRSFLPDGEYCLVVFDFPEAARRSRQSFRRLLRRIGFERLQLSVWRTKKNVIRETRALIGLLKIGKWVEAYRGRLD